MDKRITIYDLSKKLGLSTATINRALNGKPYVSEEAKKLILETAREMGFKPNKAARSLARKPIKIAVITYDGMPVFFNEITRGAKAACEELADYNVAADYYVIRTGPNLLKTIWEELTRIPYERYNGIVIVPNSDNRRMGELISGLRAAGVYVSTVVTEVIGVNTDFSIQYNGRVAGKMAAQLLVWLGGNKQVAIMTGVRSGVKIHTDTIEGFVEEAERQSLEIANIYESQTIPISHISWLTSSYATILMFPGYT